MKTTLSRFAHNFYHHCIEPRSSDVDGRRREFILNTLLSGLLAIASVALLFSIFIFFYSNINPSDSGVLQTFVFWAIIFSLLVVSRRGRPKVAALIFVGFLLLSSIQFAVVWSFRLAQAELVFALTIVIAGVLFRASLALVSSAVVALSLLIITYLQVHHLQIPQTDWEGKPLYFEDTVGYIAIFVIIGIVSWLSNRETDRSLKRARRSEAALQKERDNLEAKVIARTHELEELQVARLLEMQPFAEFGRIGASLVHEIANPLTAASMHLEELNRQQHSELVHQVQRNLQHLEKYLVAARKQIKRESDLRTFSVGAELRQIVRLLTHRARRANVRLVVDKISNVKLYGDVVKFDQMVANLIANAIDASEKVADPLQRQVVVRVSHQVETTTITITDSGAGIKASQIDHLFEPFYSTKGTARSGLSIGLALVKQYAEHDFKGSIAVVSTDTAGTTFTLVLNSQDRS